MTDEAPTMDPTEVGRLFAEVAERTTRLFGDHFAKQSAPRDAPVFDEFGIGKAYMDLWTSWFANPQKAAQTQIELYRDYLSLWQESWLKMLGAPASPVATPAHGDYRFESDDWQNHFLFDFIKQSYLIAARHVHRAAVANDELSPESRKKVEFFTRQTIDALSPTNFVHTNPEVMRETLKTGGANLLRGLNNLLRDLEAGDGQLRVKMVDDQAFKLGENVASCPGKVIYQNDLIQLIQYDPLTEKVYKTPLLIVPPWINKFYILDLREKNSFIRWAAGEGHTVFVVSWVNPDARLASKSFEDYMLEGPLAALSAIEKATGVRRANVIGYCLGGTLLGATLAVLSAKKDERIASATFFVSLLDFSMPGELGVFIDEKQVANLERRMHARGGFLEGSEMAASFNLLRANDLVWSFVVNNYLLGREPMPFDLLYWNADSTRMPARMHSYYLRNMYLNNALKDPGGIELQGVPLDLRCVTTPAYFISTVEDHIAPWQSTYRGAQILGGPVRFVLGGSGHIAGIINPPAANKYGFWSQGDPRSATQSPLPAEPVAWQEAATKAAGSWWNDWQAWIDQLNGGVRVAARKPGAGKLKAIEDAPGSYVKLRLAPRR